jgi:hypothetical protein
MRTSEWLGAVALVVAGVAAYHFAVAPRRATAPSDGGEAVEGVAERVEALERRLVRLEGGSGTPRRTNGALEARVAELETALRAGRGPTPAGDGSQPARWTEGDLAALRSMLDEVDRRKRVEATRNQVEFNVDRAVPDLPAETRTALVDRVVVYLEDTRAIQTEAATAKTPEERQAMNGRLENLRAKLSLDIQRSFPDVGEKLLQALPWTQPRRMAPPPR